MCRPLRETESAQAAQPWALRWARETAVRTTVLWVEGCPPDVEGRRLQRPILLLHDDDIDALTRALEEEVLEEKKEEEVQCVPMDKKVFEKRQSLSF